MIAVFGDEALLRAGLAFEAALARAQAAEGLIPEKAAALIARVCAEAAFDIPTLAEEAAHAGTLAIPLVAQLRADLASHDPAVAKLAHLGATSQDLADTAMMLQVKAGAELIRAEAVGLAEALAGLAEAHAETLMLGRTLLQGALPITLGLKAASWLLGVDDALRRFDREAAEAIRLQLGGATGSMVGLTFGVADRMGAELGLAVAPTPWHARRDGVAGIAAALAILTGSVGKIARDVSLMAQGEVAEAFEPKVVGRGGSSAMAHKRNPTGCQVALSAAIRAPGLVATLLSGLPQEHERGLGGWQAEAPHVASLFELTHGALVAMRGVIEGLDIDAAALQINLEHADVGADAGQSVALVGRALAHYRRDP